MSRACIFHSLPMDLKALETQSPHTVAENNPLEETREMAMEELKKLPPDCPMASKLRQTSRICHIKMAERWIRQANLEDPMEMIHLVKKWGRPRHVCLRLSDQLENVVEGSPIEAAREAARRIETPGHQEKLPEIGEVLKEHLSAEDPIPVGMGPRIKLSFTTHETQPYHEHAHANQERTRRQATKDRAGAG